MKRERRKDQRVLFRVGDSPGSFSWEVGEVGERNINVLNDRKSHSNLVAGVGCLTEWLLCILDIMEAIDNGCLYNIPSLPSP